ncbi:uncharacterized protein PAC_07613 [Phialocephala subalpina]|uniref:Uncharacterized protein n=1 Tax=Phialocephala subalpina TaxID=576137 RepID=A0A1L7WY86_9HELO|nr:uncharacterized protein PAC_07613 [Phialocephala subalpina]
MSADFPSSNPFRRKAATPAPPQDNPSNIHHVAYEAPDPQPALLSLDSINVPKKVTKKVRVQSPPPLSPSTPSLPDSASTIGEENYSFSARPPTPPIPHDDDPFDTATSDTSEDEELNKSKAPANPFSKTLETMENPQRDVPTKSPTNVSSPGRASMDVEAFKRLLMTGNSGLGTSTPPTASQVHVTHALGDGGSSTDASSISRQSIFEAVQEPHPESPRTSHEISEPEDDRRRFGGEASLAGRKKPPPPSSRHGKLIRVELRDDASTTALQSPPIPGSITSQHYFSSSPRSQTDLNKPLPPAPNRASHDLDRESIFDKEAAGKTPEPPSPPDTVRRKAAPAPPLARRHSQKLPDSKRNINDPSRLSPKPEEESSSATLTPTENSRPRSDSGRAPPPPPSRRIGSVRHNSSHNLPLSSPSTVSLPSPPPVRGSSRSISGGRPPSVHSMDLSSKHKSGMPPPPPPPHRHGRTSFDGQSPGDSRRTSGDYPRRSMDSVRRGSAASSVVLHLPEEAAETETGAERHDILADLSKLQAEIDALRNQAGK